MTWWGAGIGAGIGMLLGGPFGALIGAGIGSSMTREAPSYGGGSVLDNGERKQIGFLVATFSMLGKLAKADGQVSKDEIAFVDAFIQKELELDPNAKRIAVEIFNRAKSEPTPIDRYAAQFAEIFRDDGAMRETIYRVLFRTAMADGRLHPAEAAILQRLPLILGLPATRYRELESELAGNLEGCYAILECATDASDAEVKRAYRQKCMAYHPDKLASKGLPEGFTKFANDQIRQFTEAYNQIMTHRRKAH